MSLHLCWYLYKDVLKLSIEDYEYIRRLYDSDLSEKIEVLAGISAFKSFSKVELVQLCDALMPRKFIPNKSTPPPPLFFDWCYFTVIMEQGSEPTGVYFVKAGKCKMIKEMEVRKIPPPKPSVFPPPPFFFSAVI